jgi:uncharacterized protein (TIGR02996 family)
MDEHKMLAAYAASPRDVYDRLLLADFFEERGDPRAAWLRDPELAPWMGPEVANPFVKLVAALPDEGARAVLLHFGGQAVPALLDALPGGLAWSYENDREEVMVEVLAGIASATPGLPELMARLSSDDPREQRAALDALGEMGEAAGPAVPAMFRLLHDPRTSILETAVATLGRWASSPSRPSWRHGPRQDGLPTTSSAIIGCLFP